MAEAERMSEERLHRLLPRFLGGNLDEDEMARFRDHLEDCDECRAEKAFLEEVREHVDLHGEAVFADHPEVDRLVAYVAGDLSDEDEAEIRQHLELCATCRLESRWITGEAVAAARVPTSPGRRSGGPWGWIAIAAAILFAFLLPVFMMQGDRPTTTGIDPQLIAPIERAAGREAVVRLPAGEARLYAYLPIDLPASDFPCEVEVAREDGETIYRESVASPDDLLGGLHLFFACAQADCTPGSYTVRIETAGGRQAEAIPFRVTER